MLKITGKRLVALLLALLMAISLAACGGSDSEPIKAGAADSDNEKGGSEVEKARQLIADLSGEWTPQWSSSGLQESVYLTEEGFTIRGKTFKYKFDEYAMTHGFESVDDYFTLDTEEFEDGKIYHMILVNNEYGHSMSVSTQIYKKDGDYYDFDLDIGSFICSAEYTTVTLTSENWQDYLVLKQTVRTEKNEFEEIEDMEITYKLLPADDKIAVTDADIAVEFEYSDYVEKTVTYHASTGAYELSAESENGRHDAGSDDVSLSTYDLTEDFGRGLFFTYSDDFVRDGDVCTAKIRFPEHVHILRVQGTVKFRGEPDTTLGAALNAPIIKDWEDYIQQQADDKAKEEQEAAQKEETEKAERIAAEADTLKDKDGYCYRIFHSQPISSLSNVYFGFHYDAEDCQLKEFDIIDVYFPSDATLDSVKANIRDIDTMLFTESSSRAKKDGANEHLKDLYTIDVYQNDTAIFVEYSFKNLTSESLIRIADYVVALNCSAVKNGSTDAYDVLSFVSDTHDQYNPEPFLRPDSGDTGTGAGWKKVSGKWYFFNANGEKQTGWVSNDGKWYYLDSEGAMKTGWLKENGKWYYLKSDGSMAASEGIEIDSESYFFDSNGVCLNP